MSRSLVRGNFRRCVPRDNEFQGEWEDDVVIKRLRGYVTRMIKDTYRNLYNNKGREIDFLKLTCKLST